MKMTEEKSILSFVKNIGRPIFTTFELAAVSGKSLSAVTQALNYLESQGIIFKIYRGVWGETGSDRISPYAVIPFLLPSSRAYVSFISALHLYGVIEQIPQMITAATTSHTKIIKTRLGNYSFHRIDPWFFDGFIWYKGTENFLIAEPEKALVDSLYLSSRKKKQFGYFPELYFPESFSFKKTQEWVKRIPNDKIKTFVRNKLDRIKKQ